MKRSKLWMALVSASVALSVAGYGSMDALKSEKDRLQIRHYGTHAGSAA